MRGGGDVTMKIGKQFSKITLGCEENQMLLSVDHNSNAALEFFWAFSNICPLPG